jgi:hypothetical protein
MMAQRRWALSLGLVILGGALTFLLGLCSGAPDDAAVALYAAACLAVAALIVVLAVRIMLGKLRKGEDIEMLFAVLGVLLGAMFMAALTETFVVGISVAFHQGWGDPEIQEIVSDPDGWYSSLSELRRGAPAAGAVIGAILGFVGWGSRFTDMWSEPPAKIRPN